MGLIEFEIKEYVAFIRLNRPDKLNSFTMPMADEMKEALKKCDENENIRCVVITGNGKAFCAGQDLAEAVEKGKNPEFELSEIIEHTYSPIVSQIRALKKPVIAAVNGTAAGAGANIAFVCDLIFAKTSAKFIQSFSMIGLIPDSGGTWTLPRLVGPQKAAGLMMLGDKMTANEAVQSGMIYKVFSDEEFDAEILNVASKLAKMPTKGLALTKKALQKSQNNSFEEQLKLETELQSQAGRSYDYNEGVQAFLEKRKPEFKGK